MKIWKKNENALYHIRLYDIHLCQKKNSEQ